jgi:hypothetical protein
MVLLEVQCFEKYRSEPRRSSRDCPDFTDKAILEACLTLEAYPRCYTNRNQAGRDWSTWLNCAREPKEQCVNRRGEKVTPPGRGIFVGVESEIADTIFDKPALLSAKRNALALLYHYAHGHTEDCLCKTWTWYQKEGSSRGSRLHRRKTLQPTNFVRPSPQSLQTTVEGGPKRPTRADSRGAQGVVVGTVK